MEMEYDTIVIKIRDSDPLCVSVERLISDSSVFRHLICDLSFTELEMDDFSPDVVGLFFTLLEDKQGGEIQETHFRELHKLAVVFEVKWLTERCREWLTSRLNRVDSGMEHDAKLFLFEESYYILQKWDVSNFMNLLVSKLAAGDNSSFIAQYMRKFSTLSPQELDIMIDIGGSNIALFIIIIIESITEKEFLDQNTKHLLKNINLALCFEQDEELYHQLFHRISTLSGLKLEDLSFVMELTTQVTRFVSRCCKKARGPRGVVLFDNKEFSAQLINCKSLDAIIQKVAEKKITSMFVVVDFLMKVALEHPPSTEEAEVFVRKLETCCLDQPLNKVFPEYIDMILPALMLSDRQQQKVQCIALLQLVRESEKLTSYQDIIVIQMVNQSTTINMNGSILYRKYHFEYKHPATPHCDAAGKCGFILKSYNESIVELSRDEAEYKIAGLHYHDIVCAGDMYFYVTWPGTTADGTRVKVADITGWAWWWLPEVKNWVAQEIFVAYNIKDYLVAKRDGHDT